MSRSTVLSTPPAFRGGPQDHGTAFNGPDSRLEPRPPKSNLTVRFKNHIKLVRGGLDIPANRGRVTSRELVAAAMAFLKETDDDEVLSSAKQSRAAKAQTNVDSDSGSDHFGFPCAEALGIISNDREYYLDRVSRSADYMDPSSSRENNRYGPGYNLWGFNIISSC